MSKLSAEEKAERHRDEVQRRGISLPQFEVNAGPQKLTLEGMYQQVKSVLELWIERASETYEWTPDQLVELEGEGRTGDKRTQHEIRLKEIGPLFEENFVGKIRTDLFEFHLHQLLERCLVELLSEQDHLNWALVAAKVDRRVSSTSQVKRTEQTVPVIEVAQFSKPTPIEQGTRTIWETVPSYGVHLELVFADLLGGDPKDPNVTAQVELIPGSSPMAAYAETRQLRDMPKGLRIQWERAERLLRDFYGLPQRQREDLGKLRRRQPRTPKLDGAPVPRQPRPEPEIRTPEVPPTQGLAAAIRGMMDQGSSPKAIAARTGKTVEEIDAILAASERPS
ncbi:MAG TPA: hypothetical protein VI792_03320 [Candidatus Eisenbacteria bacterium]